MQTYSGSNYTLAYDTELNLTSISSGGTTPVTYGTDVFQRRVTRTSGGTGVVSYFGPDGHVWYDSAGAVYAWGNALIRKDGEYPMFDGLGSERTVTNSSQTVTGTISYDAFGQTVATTGSSANPYKWLSGSGYRDDGDFGLVSVGARVYDPEVGRFLERDSRLDQLAYTYCGGDPVNSVDPSGRNIVAIDPFTHRPVGFPGPPDNRLQGGLTSGAGVVIAIIGVATLDPVLVVVGVAGFMSGATLW